MCFFGLPLLTIIPLYLSGSQLEDELEGVATHMIYDMAAKHWNKEVMYEYASLQYKRNYPNTLIRTDLLQWGKFKAHEGTVHYSKKSSRTEGITARVVTKTKFDKGPGYIDLRLRKEQEQWRMDAIEISKDAPQKNRRCHRHGRRRAC